MLKEWDILSKPDIDKENKVENKLERKYDQFVVYFNNAKNGFAQQFVLLN